MNLDEKLFPGLLEMIEDKCDEGLKEAIKFIDSIDDLSIEDIKRISTHMIKVYTNKLANSSTLDDMSIIEILSYFHNVINKLHEDHDNKKREIDVKIINACDEGLAAVVDVINSLDEVPINSIKQLILSLKCRASNSDEDKKYTDIIQYFGELINDDLVFSNISQESTRIELVQPKAVFRHFKGDYYVVICLSKDSETEELNVVYQNTKTKEIYNRPLEMFTSVVDKGKYPEFTQMYRFEFCFDMTDFQ